MQQAIRQIVHKAPRTDYGPRKLVRTEHGRFDKARGFGKAPHAPRGGLTLPEAWSIVCPNRITERRKAAGMEFVTDLHRAVEVISYQRLVRMEIGRVIIRDSEYELVADALGLTEDDLKLPILTHSETVEWARKWGAQTQIEEGGDEDSVILAAYVRKLVSVTGVARTALCEQFGAPANCLARIWYAEKPIDRWPDSTMTVVIKLSKARTWDDVVTRARALYRNGGLVDEIADVVRPRIRYAPEDPDRKAPWTYETDPLRTRKGKRQTQTPLSAAPMTETAYDRKRREARELKQARKDELAAMRAAYVLVIDEARHGDQRHLIETQFPDAPARQVDDLLRDPALAAMVIARVALVRAARNTAQREHAADLLGLSEERIRQIAKMDDGRLSSFLPKTRLGFQGGFNS